MGNAQLAAQFGDTVGGVLRHQATQVHFHTLRHGQPAALPVQLVQADFLQRFVNDVLRRCLLLAEFPQPCDRSQSDIKQALTLFVIGQRMVEQLARFLVNLDSQLVASRAIDFVDETVTAIARVFLFDA